MMITNYIYNAQSLGGRKQYLLTKLYMYISSDNYI